MIEICKDEIRIGLNKKFYDIGTIRDSLKDFRKICNGKVRDGDVIEIVLKPRDKKMIKILGYEFYNYVLGMMKNKAIV